MSYRELESKKKCKDCGEMAHSWQVGWEDPETKEIHWHPPKHYNHCKRCRSEKAKTASRNRHSQNLNNTKNKGGEK